MIVPYAARTGTRRNLAMLRELGWRLMVSARGVLRTEGFRYALDNGAWTAFQRKEAFDFGAFEKAVAQLGAGADFIVAPDIVLGGLESLRLSESWLPRLTPVATTLVAVQNGMTTQDIAPLLSSRVGVFVGGDTAWKLATMPTWGALGAQRGAIVHVGRVNSERRIKACIAAGVTSFDGSNLSRYAVNARRIDSATRQGALFAPRRAEA